MSDPADQQQPFPGPPPLGRGIVIDPGGPVPAAAAGWPRLVVDRSTMDRPAGAVARLDELWRQRVPSVVELGVPLAEMKQPETCELPVHRLGPEFTFDRERLHFLIWVNRYDGRGDRLRWPHARRARALGAGPAGEQANGDVVLPTGEPAWIDGGPRTAGLELSGPASLVHVHQLWADGLAPDRSGSAAATDLAPDQAAAVAHGGGPARVLAPAGSGKTRVLTARLRHLLRDRGWAPGSVTALAYNNRAAAEMRHRTQDVPGAQVRTLHALGYEILGRARDGRPRLLDEREVRNLLDGLAPVRRRANDDVYAPYLEALAEVRACLRSPETVEAAREDAPGFAGMFDDYRDRLDRMGAIDHDEQIYGAVEVLLRDPEVRQHMQRRCAHLLLDELQDLTPAQLLLVRLLTAPAYDVYGVGDDDQVIYGYAGADPRFLVDYAEFFPGAASYLLEVNYRCPPPVVDAASKLLAHNRTRVAKATRSPGGETGGEDGLLVERAGDDEIGKRLVAAVGDRLAAGVEPSEVAVLTRVNSGLLAPHVLLTDADVPVASPVDDRMLERTGARAALAWLRLAAAARDKQPLDGPDLATAVRRPPRKLSPGLLKAIGNGTWSLGRLAGYADGLDRKQLRQGLQTFCQDLERLGDLARAGGSTHDLLVEIRDAVGLGSALGNLDGARSAARGGHVDDLGALILVAFARPDVDSFELWLRQVLGRRGDRGAEGVTLSTVHRVKGLEWPHVLVWDASDGVMPHHLNRSGAELEEERRVFHVALTRAQETATVLARTGAESPFLAEMAGLPSPLARRRPAAPPSREADGGRTAAPADGRARKGIDALKTWRRERAEQDGVPAYVVLSDKHLEGIARDGPATLDALLDCDGIGPTKLERYGADILAVLEGVGDPA